MHQLDLFKDDYRPVKSPSPRRAVPHEYKVVSLRDCPMPADRLRCDTPERVVEYWNLHIATTPHFNPDAESFAVLLLTTRKHVKGHQLVTIGLLDQVLTHCRETFRAAIVAAAHSVVLVHNHPSGDPTPSDSDIRMTREFIRAGQLLRIEVIDHIILGDRSLTSMRSLGLWHR